MGGSQNESLKVPIWETSFEWKVVKMVDTISRVRFEVCGKEDWQGEHRVYFCARNPIEGEDGKENFLDEDILDIELEAWKMYFDGAMNQYGNE